jgi:hypothetical protein
LFDPKRMLAVGAAFASAVVLASQQLDSSLLPIANSPDVAHHAALIRWISLNGRVPTAPSANLGEMVAYPFGSHILAALGSRVFGVEPVRAMNIVAFAMLGLVAAAIWSVSSRLGALAFPHSSSSVVYSAALVSTLGLIMAPTYWSSAVTGDFFFAQVCGLYLTMVCVLFALEGGTGRATWASTIAAAALVFAYPLFIPIAAIVLAVLFLLRWRHAGLISGLRFMTISLGLVVVSAVLFLPGRTDTGEAILNNEGGIAPVTVANLGGPVLLALCIVGAMISAVLAVRSRRFVLLLTVLTGIAAIVIRFAISASKNAGHLGSKYQATKFVFVAFYSGLAMAPLAVLGLLFIGAWAIRWRRDNDRGAARDGSSALVGLSTTALIGLLGFGPRFAQGSPPLDPDVLAVARWAMDHVDAQQVDPGIPGGGGYLVWVGVLGRDRTPRSLDRYSATFDVVADWTRSPDEYIIVNCAAVAVVEAAGRPVTLIFSSGDACLLGPN